MSADAGQTYICDARMLEGDRAITLVAQRQMCPAYTSY